MEFRADLHCHTTASDGSFTPQELIHHAIEVGLQALSITDHDTVDAYKQAIPLAKEVGLELMPGIELSSSHRGVPVHILGYNFILDHPVLQALLKKHGHRRTDRNTKILEKLASLGFPIKEEELCHGETTLQNIGRPHFALVLKEKGIVDSIQKAFKLYLGEGKPAYEPGELISIEETLNAIHEAQGLAVIAHPHLILKQSIFRQLLDMNFDGIECYYSRFDKAHNDKFLKIAKSKNWLVTGGSDFHGTIKPGVNLGCSWVSYELFNLLKKEHL